MDPTNYQLLYLVRDTDGDPEEAVVILSPGTPLEDVVSSTDGFKVVDTVILQEDMVIWPLDRLLVP